VIPKPEILSIAKSTGLQASTVEKDYVLSWVLYGISKNEQLSGWIFKGGTCLKKCYFETYRFSEDLDFTVPPGAVYDAIAIQIALSEIATFLYSETGIEIRQDTIEVSESLNKNGAQTFDAKFGYVGPLNYNVRALPRIKFDITSDEIITEPPDIRAVFHNYTDAPPEPANIKCYSINEILAEKTRALYQRQGRARDLYDVINIGRNFREDVDIVRARFAAQEKFRFKGLPEPSVPLIFDNINFEQLRANWNGQLSHQLPVLPPVESFYDNLQVELSWWLDEINLEPVLPKLGITSSESVEPKVHFPSGKGIYQRRLGIGKVVNNSEDTETGSILDQVRYAARNRLCIAFEYSGTRRVAEPYSLRRPRTGNLLLYVFERNKGGYIGGGINAFQLNRINNIEILQEAFQPRFAVEL
jgi:predicted nucleotidyltransferase component of viral defense system